MPDESVLKALVGLPNAKYPSDHLPLVFGFRFKKSDAFTTCLPFDGAGGSGGGASADGGGADGGEQSLPATSLVQVTA